MSNANLGQAIKDTLEDAMAARSDLVADALMSAEQSLVIALSGSNPIALETRLDSLEIASGIDLGFVGSVGVTPVLESSRLGLGALLRGDCAGTRTASPDLSATETFAAGYHVDVLNQILYAAFVGTARPLAADIDAEGEAWQDLIPEGATLLELSLEEHLPSVLSDCSPQGGEADPANRNSQGGLEVQVGAARVLARFALGGDEYVVQVWLNGVAGVELESAGTSWTLSVSPVEWLAGETRAAFAPEALHLAAEALGRRFLEARLFDQRLRELFAGLPVMGLDLSPLDEGAMTLIGTCPAIPDAGVLVLE